MRETKAGMSIASSVQDYAATHGTPTWRFLDDERGRANLQAAERERDQPTLLDLIEQAKVVL